MRQNAIVAASPLPGVYPGGTGRTVLLGEYSSALEATWRLRNALSLMTVAGRDYAGADEHARAVAAHRECLDMAEDVSRHMYRVMNALREVKP